MVVLMSFSDMASSPFVSSKTAAKSDLFREIVGNWQENEKETGIL